jgi:hypothetical protein
MALAIALAGRAVTAPAERAAAAPIILFEETAVTLKGLTPEGLVVLFSIAWESEKGVSQLVRRESLLPDSNGDGEVRKDLGKPIPDKSIWFAVDLTSGELGIRQPRQPHAAWFAKSPFPVWSLPFTLDHLELRRDFVQLVVVRPRVGAWGGRVRDGFASDPDGKRNGIVPVRLDRLWALGDSPPPPQVLAAGDLLLIVDPTRGQYMTFRLRHGGG